MSERSQTFGAGVKLVVFAVVSVVTIVTIAGTIRPLGAGGTQNFRAEFANASRVKPGDEVRVAGVVVGRVDSVELTPRSTAEIAFNVEKSLNLTTASTAEIRFLNIVGDRYIALDNPVSGAPDQPHDKPIDLGRTRPALDLNDVFNGFKPLFAALSPEDVNRLSEDIVAALQGEGDTVQSLLASTASVTTELANRDELIGQVITNLNATVGTVSGRHEDLERLITQLDRFVSGLATDRKTIGQALGHVDSLADLTADLLEETRGPVRKDIESLGAVTKTLSTPENQGLLKHALDHLPDKLGEISRTASYGSWFSYYLCVLNVNFETGDGIDPVVAALLRDIRVYDTSARCNS